MKENIATRSFTSTGFETVFEVLKNPFIESRLKFANRLQSFETIGKQKVKKKVPLNLVRSIFPGPIETERKKCKIKITPGRVSRHLSPLRSRGAVTLSEKSCVSGGVSRRHDSKGSKID